MEGDLFVTRHRYLQQSNGQLKHPNLQHTQKNQQGVEASPPWHQYLQQSNGHPQLLWTHHNRSIQTCNILKKINKVLKHVHPNTNISNKATAIRAHHNQSIQTCSILKKISLSALQPSWHRYLQQSNGHPQLFCPRFTWMIPDPRTETRHTFVNAIWTFQKARTVQGTPNQKPDCSYAEHSRASAYTSPRWHDHSILQVLVTSTSDVLILIPLGHPVVQWAHADEQGRVQLSPEQHRWHIFEESLKQGTTTSHSTATLPALGRIYGDTLYIDERDHSVHTFARPGKLMESLPMTPMCGRTSEGLWDGGVWYLQRSLPAKMTIQCQQSDSTTTYSGSGAESIFHTCYCMKCALYSACCLSNPPRGALWQICWKVGQDQWAPLQLCSPMASTHLLAGISRTMIMS